jgi:tight adherence protein C
VLFLLLLSLLLTAVFVVVGVLDVVAGRPQAVTHRLDDVASIGSDPYSAVQRRRRLMRRERLLEFLADIGLKLQGGGEATPQRELLIHAGFRSANALPTFIAVRLLLALGMGVGAFTLVSVAGLARGASIFAALYFAAMGYVVPLIVVRMRKTRLQKDIQKALADALDLLVVCVEAGLGLNQALMRVAREIRHVSMVLSRELALVNSEIRAGAPRDQALRSLADRTGVADVRSLTTMLVQTERFGTSIARSLRVHSDTLREKRRQRAEEAAAKTAIKLVFPLVLCIFPALFVVILGPGLIMIYRALTGLS